MKFKLHARHTAVLLALLGAAATGHVNAQSFYDNGQRAVLLGDPDNTGDGGAAVLSEGGTAASGLVLFDAEGNSVNGLAELFGNDVRLRSNGGISLNSATTNTITGANNNINGITTITGATTVTGATTLTGATSVTGVTTINTSGSAATSINTGTSTGNVTIGNSGNITTIQSATNNINGTTNNVTGATNINVNTNAATSINSGTSAGNVTIGNSLNTTNIQSGTNNITGVTNINASNNAVTNINTGTSNSAVFVGNNANTVNINGGTNNIGTGSLRTTNNIGNTVSATTVLANGGNATMSLANNAASLTVPSGAAGVNNGFAAAPTQSSMTGGDTDPTRMVLTDRAASFSRVSNGAPITVTGVADGRADFDAVNVRQFAGAVAAVSAQANIPGLQQGQDRSIGLGVGNFMGKTALAMGLNLRANNAAVYRLSVSTGTQGGTKPVVGAGAAWSF